MAKDKYDQAKGADDGSKCYIPTILFLSCMLMSTLYLLRYDNSQLEVAAQTINSIKERMKEMQEQISAGSSGFTFPADIKAGIDSAELEASQKSSGCVAEAELLKQVKENKTALDASVEALQEQFDEMADKNEQELFNLKTVNNELESQIMSLYKEKRVLAKKLGIKMAAETAEE